MANFAMDPARFILEGMQLEDGGQHRLARRTVFLSRDVQKYHESYAIAVTDEVDLTPAQITHIMHMIRHYIEVQHRKHVESFQRHPHGIGIFRLCDACERDTLVVTSPHRMGNFEFRFVKHDEATMNLHRSPFTRTCWVMLLGFPLDLRLVHFVDQVCSCFGQMLQWNPDDPNLARILVYVLVDNALDIPRSIAIKHGREADGEGRSWTVPVYICNSQLLAQPGDEEDPPANNGNPHPFHGPIVLDEAEFVADLADQFIDQHGHGQMQQPEQQQNQDQEELSNASDSSVVQPSFTGSNASFAPGNSEEVLALLNNEPEVLPELQADQVEDPLVMNEPMGNNVMPPQQNVVPDVPPGNNIMVAPLAAPLV
ncbi:hypothetical protein QOZ80_1BG0061260 [Eleusine coracana subsp. coracana]|nr:hypothetical protein QOZ80_1BG0061260 [Eleusine coracana subsp. coracana]